MANRNTGKSVPKNHQIVPPENVDSGSRESVVKAVSLRVPDHLHEQARLCAESCGIPLNGLICIALADYLSEKGYCVHLGANYQKGI